METIIHCMRLKRDMCVSQKVQIKKDRGKKSMNCMHHCIPLAVSKLAVESSVSVQHAAQGSHAHFTLWGASGKASVFGESSVQIQINAAKGSRGVGTIVLSTGELLVKIGEASGVPRGIFARNREQVLGWRWCSHRAQYNFCGERTVACWSSRSKQIAALRQGCPFAHAA